MPKNEDLDKFTQELQEQIMEQVKQRYTQTVIDLWQNPKNFRKIDSPDGYVSVKGSCGDTMEMFLMMKDKRIYDCTFITDGCGTTLACGSAATELAKNKTFIQAQASVGADSILKNLGGLPKKRKLSLSSSQVLAWKKNASD